MTTVTGAVARRDKELQLINWLRGQQEDLGMAAASHLKPATIIRVAQGALRKDDKLMAAAIANPQSLIHCLLDAARLGHEAGTDQYWLIPFGQEVTGIEGYKGIIERMFRAGGVSAVVAEVVRQKDVYRNRGPLTPPVHEFDEFADPEDRGTLRGVYAYARMFDGQFSRVIPMGRAEIMKHKEKSKGSGKPDSPWKNWEEAMWKKTPLRALETYVPTSSEWLNVRAQAAWPADKAVVASGWSPPASAVTADTAAPLQLVAAELVDEPQNVPPAPAASPVAAPVPPSQDAGEAPQPPLPGEEEPSGPAPSGQPAANETAPGPDERDHDTPGTATRGKGGQLTALWTILSTVFHFGDEEKAQARSVCEHIIGRDLDGGTTGDLSYNEARTVLDTLSHWKAQAEGKGEHPHDYLISVMVAEEAARDE